MFRALLARFRNARLRRMRAELADLDSWIPCLEILLEQKRARRKVVLAELVDQPDDVVRRSQTC